MKLYVKDIVREPRDSLYTFLKKCIESGKFKCYGNFPKTYFDKDCVNLESDIKFRSFEVIVKISKTYFKVSEKQIARALKKFLKEEKMGFLYCMYADKWIFYIAVSYMGWENKERFILNHSNSIEKTNLKGIGEYSFDEIEKLMND